MTLQTLWSATWPQKSSPAGSGRQQVQWRKRFRVPNTRKSSEQPKLDGRAWVVRNRCGGQELKINPGESWSLGSWGVSKSTSVLPRPLGKASKVPGQDGKGWSRRSWRGVTYDRRSSKGFHSNLSQWKLANPSRCGMCEGHGTLQHILSACPRALGQGMYTWRHDQVLLVIAKAVEKAAEVANQESGESDEGRHIHFVSEGGGTDQKAGRPQKRVKILQGGCNWKVESDLSGRLVFPVAAAITLLRPDLVIWSDAARVLIVGKLTVPWEEHMQEANECNKTKYAPLMTECAEKQWQVHCLPFEVGCRGFVGTSLMTFLHKLGITHREKSVCKAASNAALRASTWIWAKHRNGPSWCHQAPVRSGSGVSALVHWPTSPMWYWV